MAALQMIEREEELLRIGTPKVSESKAHNEGYKTAQYWSLPENVRNAIDIAKMRSKHSEFFYKLQTLNDKIYVFRRIFYNRMPIYDKIFLEKKKKELE
jgi:hypothetical protein